MMSSPTRRDLLRIGGLGLAFVAGCTSAQPSGSESPESTTSGTTQQTPDAPSVTVTDVHVTPEVVSLNSPDSIGVVGERDQQFVIARVRTETDDPLERGKFNLRIAENEFGALDTSYGSDVGTLWEYRSTRYEQSTGGYLVFQVPKPVASQEISIRWRDEVHPLSEETTAQLATDPTNFAVREFTTPESVRAGENVTLTLIVENTGTTDGTFVGALNRIGPQVAYTPVQKVALDVKAGATTTWSYPYTPSLGSSAEGRKMHYTMLWRDGDEKATTTVKPYQS
ncbi:MULTISPECIES: hypothetical protein [unclassified Haladaptatus]|uniref:hypothetical protein n=1 Tax=unclassified Haladaptatus TaxID=2622732 RepID=UPI0023E7878F|nr:MULTISPECIES: hypothetical protein [unclassified Haladaptatus]